MNKRPTKARTTVLELERLCYTSTMFRTWVIRLREKYGIPLRTDRYGIAPGFLNSKTYIQFKANHEVRATFSSCYHTKLSNFDKEVKKLCEYFFVTAYYEDIRKYIYSGYFAPLAESSRLTIEENYIVIRAHKNITKEDFLGIWDQFMGLAGEEKRKRWRREEYFDAKLMLYKKEKMGIEPPGQYKTIVADIASDITRKSRFLAETKRYIETLRQKSEL